MKVFFFPSALAVWLSAACESHTAIARLPVPGLSSILASLCVLAFVLATGFLTPMAVTGVRLHYSAKDQLSVIVVVSRVESSQRRRPTIDRPDRLPRNCVGDALHPVTGFYWLLLIFWLEPLRGRNLWLFSALDRFGDGRRRPGRIRRGPPYPKSAKLGKKEKENISRPFKPLGTIYERKPSQSDTETSH